MFPSGPKNLIRCSIGAAFALVFSFQALAISADEEFFESKIRPLLVENCYECHSAGKQIKGDLRLDLKSGWAQGGESGPTIIPGDPESSLLVRALRYSDDELQMPPKKKGKLSDSQIDLIVEWIRRGAYDPREGQLTLPNPKDEHWAFQPISNPVRPTVKRTRWIKNDLDLLILAKLESNELTPSPRADPRTLIRRVFHDITGLPPTPEEVFAFEQDSSNDAYERLVDNLLSRPQYGEKWARHWMDVARYSDTKGYVFEEERAYPFAYTFRDYVIRAFNEDLPFDRFIQEQIAADQLDLGDDKRPLAAMGYLTVGRRFLNNQHDIIDDRIDVVTRGMMGLTVACARCHDHKYDPIPAADYYSLYGVFASSHEPGEKPLIGVEPPEYEAYLKEHNRRVKERDDFISDTNESIREKLRSSVGDYMLAAHEASFLSNRDAREKLAKSRQLDFGIQERWANALDKWAKQTNQIFHVWNSVRIGVTNVDTTITNEITKSLLVSHPSILVAVSNTAPTNLKDLANVYGDVFKEIDAIWNVEQSFSPDIISLQAPDEESIRNVLYGKGMPLDISNGELRRMYEVKQAQRSRALQRDVEKLDATHEGAPPRAMAMYDKSKPYDPYVFKRGQSGNRGEAVPRQFLEVLSSNRKPFKSGSGRLELAQSITSTNNPLTARVIVNRVWLHYMGQSLVKTPSDFGVRSDAPLHQDVLDYLAWTLMHEDEWSLKKLHRRILLSATYQQSSDLNPQSGLKDPDNLLYSHQNRKRLGFEAMRDSLLAVAGNLNQDVGGRSVDIEGTDYSTRRSLYAHIDRQNLPGLFRTFDLASPDTTSPKRFTTTVPQQALFLMNSPFIAGQARELAKSISPNEQAGSANDIGELYHRVVQRNPSAGEIEIAERFLEAESTRPEPPTEVPDWQYGFGQIDTDAGKVISFTPLSTFKDSQWQVSDTVPDVEHGWALLTKTGGHPGNDLKHAVIRRWTAPTNATIAIQGESRHPADQGDGIRAWIIAEESGISEHWKIQNGTVQIEAENIRVSAGDHVDLVVDCRESPNHDSFTWVATIRNEAESSGASWNTSEDFSGPIKTVEPLRPFEKLAQVLLVSNEFFFID